MKTRKGYKFIKQNMTSKNGGDEWKIGVWKKYKGKIELCKSGVHATRTPLQSLQYICGDRWFLVGARGKIIENKNDKFVASEMRLIREIPTKKVCVKFAIACAERRLHVFEEKYPADKRPRKAIEAAKAWIKNPCDETKAAAWSAARSAARSAASAARSAASAAWSASWSAAESAEKKWQNKTLLKIIREEEKLK